MERYYRILSNVVVRSINIKLGFGNMKISNLFNRIAVASVLLPPLVYFVFCGEISSLIALQIAIAIMMHEFYSILDNKTKVNKWTGIIIGIFIPAFSYFNALKYKRDLILLATLTSSIIYFIIKRVLDKEIKKSVEVISHTLFGILYVSFLFSHLIFIKNVSLDNIYFLKYTFSEGRVWLFISIFLAFGADSIAYFVGNIFGKRALSPKISPKKTVEGFFGAILFGVITAFSIRYFIFNNLTFMQVLILGFGSSIFAQLGDLGMSLFKREYGVKDSSKLLMSHGGLLDRCDSLLFVGPFVYYYIKLFL